MVSIVNQIITYKAVSRRGDEGHEKSEMPIVVLIVETT